MFCPPRCLTPSFPSTVLIACPPFLSSFVLPGLTIQAPSAIEGRFSAYLICLAALLCTSLFIIPEHEWPDLSFNTGTSTSSFLLEWPLLHHTGPLAMPHCPLNTSRCSSSSLEECHDAAWFHAVETFLEDPVFMPLCNTRAVCYGPLLMQGIIWS